MIGYPLRSTVISTLLVAFVLAACGGDDPKVLLDSAKEFMAKNDNKAAIIQIKNALQKQPNLAEGRFLLGKALLDSGDLSGAEVELRKAEELKFDPDRTLPLLARALLGKGQAKKVVEEFGKVQLSSAQGKSELQTALSMAQASLGNREAAATALSEALSAEPDNVQARLYQARLKAIEGDFAGASAIADAVLGKDGGNLEALKFMGDLLFAERKSDEALAAYRKVLKVKVDYMPAHMAIVNMLLKQAKLEDAGRQIEEIKKFAAKNPQVIFLDAQLAFLKKDFKLARELIQQVHKSMQPTPASLQLAGAIDYSLGAYGTAEESLVKALQGAPSLQIARKLLVATYLRTGQTDKALEQLQPALGKIENNPSMLSLAGEVYIQHGDYKKAEEFFAKAARLDPKDANKRTRLALTHMAEGSNQLAMQELESISASDTGTVADLALVSAYLRRNDVANALKALDVIEKKRPDDPSVFNLRGQVLVAKKDVLGARTNFEKALALKPAFYPAAASLAGLDLAENKLSEAKRRYESVLASDPKSVQAQLALAILAAKEGAKNADVANLVKKAVALDPTNLAARVALVEVYIQGREPKLAVAAAQDAIAAIPERPELMDVLGKAQLAAGDFNQAVQAFGKLSVLVPKSPLPYLKIAEVNVAAKQKDDAIKNVKKSLELQPDYLDGQRALILLYVDSGKYREAVGVARDVQRQRPKSPVGFSLEGDIAIAQKAWAEAAKAYRTGLDRAPVAELAVKLSAALSAGGDKVEAEKLAASWLKEHPSDVVFRFYLADGASARQDWASALQQYRVILRTQPDNPALLNNMAWALSKMKDVNAVEYAERANKLAPNQPAYMDTLANLLADKGDLAGAKDLLARAVDLAPKQPDIRLNFAKVLFKAGDKAEARRQLDTLVALGDKFRDQAEVSRLLKEIQ